MGKEGGRVTGMVGRQETTEKRRGGSRYFGTASASHKKNSSSAGNLDIKGIREMAQV